VHRVCAADEVLDTAYAVARELVATTAPVSVAVIRQAVLRMSGYGDPEAAFELDSKLIASCATSSDAVEGIVSFLQHRPPEFTQSVSRDLPTFLPWTDRSTQPNPM
jgi:enoyl-CoA hydratase/carnithine racemase